MSEVLLALIFLAIGVGLGALVASIVIGARHSCMPHDPEECKREAGEW